MLVVPCTLYTLPAALYTLHFTCSILQTVHFTCSIVHTTLYLQPAEMEKMRSSLRERQETRRLSQVDHASNLPIR